MDFSAAHADVVIASYLLTGFCLLALVLFIVRRDRKLAGKSKDQAND